MTGSTRCSRPTTSEAGVPFERARDRLDTITGVGKRAAETIIAEIGVDMIRFPTRRHLASWAGMAPGNNLTGGKRGSGTTTNGDLWLRDALTECAWAAARTRDTYLAAQFCRLARKIGKKKAAIAVGHSILVIAWHRLTNDCDYDDVGGDYFTRRNKPDRRRDSLIGQLHDLGYQVTLTKGRLTSPPCASKVHSPLSRAGGPSRTGRRDRRGRGARSRRGREGWSSSWRRAPARCPRP